MRFAGCFVLVRAGLLKLLLEDDFLLIIVSLLFHSGLLLLLRFFHQEVIAEFLLVLVLLGIHLVDPRTVVGRVSAECDVHELEELVHTRDHVLRACAEGVFRWSTVKQDNFVRHVGSHDEVVLHDEGSAFGLDNPPLHYFTRYHSLLRV